MTPPVIRDGPVPLPPRIPEETATPQQTRRDAPVAQTGAPSSAYVEDQPVFRAIVRDGRQLFTVNIYGGANPGIEVTPLNPHHFPLNVPVLGKEALDQLIQSLGPEFFGHMDHGQMMEVLSQPLWVQIPEGEQGATVMQSVARMLNPSGALNQDGLHSTLGSAEFQRFFQGGQQLPQGAARMLSNGQLLSVLVPPNAFAANPAAAKALLVAQGLPPGLINSIPDRALSGALSSLLQTSQTAAQNPLQFLQSIASVLTLSGVPVQDVQDLLLGMLHGSQQAGLNQQGLTPENLQAMAARLLAANNPQLLGLNQMVQSQFGQGLGQIFGAFIKVFFGGALMQSQSMWPQAVPNDRMLAELGGLFGKQRPEDKKRKRKKDKDGVEKVDAEYLRVERKGDHADEEHRQREDLNSIFIEIDE